MFESEVKLHVHLEIGVKKDGDAWVAWCPPIDVLSQGKTQSKATASLKAAVELWFESCVERGVLDQALREAGFKRWKDGETVPSDANIVHLRERKRLARHAHRRPRTTPQYISVSVPAYTLATRPVHTGATY